MPAGLATLEVFTRQIPKAFPGRPVKTTRTITGSDGTVFRQIVVVAPVEEQDQIVSELRKRATGLGLGVRESGTGSRGAHITVHTDPRAVIPPDPAATAVTAKPTTGIMQYADDGMVLTLGVASLLALASEIFKVVPGSMARGQGQEQIVRCPGCNKPKRRKDMFGQVDGELVCLGCYNESLPDLPQWGQAKKGSRSKRYSLAELQALPTLSTGQADDLKVDTGTTRIWLARVGVLDGMPYDNQVSVQKLQQGRWVVTDTYPAL